MKLPAPFGKYHLLERIAVGGMAELFLAKSFGVAGFERLLVIKKILPHMAEDQEFITMFIDEARIASTLNHSNIVQINELGKEDNDYYIAMEFVHGKDLSRIRDRLADQSQHLSIPLAVYIISRICEGLDYAHRKTDSTGENLNIIHRDVSPGNVLISYDGDVKLIDFGIAKAQNRLGQTTAGTLKGKFGYMSPEQVRGLPLDHRSDIFSVGILLFEMLTGERLFGSESDFGTLEKVRNAIVTPPTTYNSDIPPALEKIIMRTLSREPEDRYQHASDLQDALSAFLLAEGSLTTGKNLAEFMRLTFADEIATENDRLAVYRRRGYPWLEASAGEQPAAAPATPAGDDSRQAGGGATFVFDSIQDNYTPPPQPKTPDALVAVSEELATVVMPGGLPEAPAPGHTPARQDSSSPRLRKSSDALNRQHGGTPPAARPVAVKPRVRHRAPRSGTEPLRGRNLEQLRQRQRPRQSSRDVWLPFLAGLAVAGLLAALYFVFLAPEKHPAQATDGISSVGAATTLSAAATPTAAVTPPPPVAATAAANQLVRPTSPSPGSQTIATRRLNPPPEGKPAPRAQPSPKHLPNVPARQPPPAQKPVTSATAKTPAPPAVRPEQAAPPVPARPATGGTAGKEPQQPARKKTGVAIASRHLRSRPSPQPNRQGFSLLVTSHPPGATILLNGKPSGRTPGNFANLDPHRNYFVVLKKDGYKPYFHGIKPGRQKRVKVAAKMQAAGMKSADPNKTKSSQKGYLVANTRPWARVIVDGKDTGRWTPIPPANKIALPAGRHTVLFRTKDGKELKEIITVEAGKLIKIIRKIP